MTEDKRRRLERAFAVLAVSDMTGDTGEFTSWVEVSEFGRSGRALESSAITYEVYCAGLLVGAMHVHG